MTMPDYPAVLAYLSQHLPSYVPLEFRMGNTITDGERWLGWARSVGEDEGQGYTTRVQRESMREVYEVVKEKEK